MSLPLPTPVQGGGVLNGTVIFFLYFRRGWCGIVLHMQMAGWKT